MSTATDARLTSERDLVEALRAALLGEVIDRAHPDYDRGRAVWNGLIDKQPAVIARCTSTARRGRGGAGRPRARARREHPGRGAPGRGQRGVRRRAGHRPVPDEGHPRRPGRAHRTRAAGVTWGELDRATQLLGLVTPGGEVSTTGIATPGPADEGMKALAPLRQLGAAVDDASGTVSYLDVQSSINGLFDDAARRP